MVDTARLRGVIAERGFSQRGLAKAMGITENTFYRKMQKGVFDSDEMEFMIKILEIKNPIEIFFAHVGA